MNKKNKLRDIELIPVNGIIGALKIYFKEIWQKEIKLGEMPKALELRNFTEQDLRNLSSTFRNSLFDAFGFNFSKLIYALSWSTILLDSFSIEKKIIFRLDKIFWATASDKDLEDYLLFWSEKMGSTAFEKKLLRFTENRKKALLKTRRKSIIPERKDLLNDDPVLQYFLASLDSVDQEVN
jgi:hypothetical protein